MLHWLNGQIHNIMYDPIFRRLIPTTYVNLRNSSTARTQNISNLHVRDRVTFLKLFSYRLQQWFSTFLFHATPCRFSKTPPLTINLKKIDDIFILVYYLSKI